MIFYIAFYKNKQITVEAKSSYEVQQKAAKEFKIKKLYEIIIMIANINHSTQYI